MGDDDDDDGQKGQEKLTRLDYSEYSDGKKDILSDGIAKKKVVGRENVSQVRLKMMELDIGMSLNKVFFNGCQFKDAKELMTAAINASKYVHIVINTEDDQSHIQIEGELIEEMVDHWFD